MSACVYKISSPCLVGGSPASLQCADMQGGATTKAQQNAVIQVETSTGPAYLWNGDMWQSSADGVKAHDLQYTAPLMWRWDAAAAMALPAHINWQNEFTIDML